MPGLRIPPADMLQMLQTASYTQCCCAGTVVRLRITKAIQNLHQAPPGPKLDFERPTGQEI